MTFLSNDPNADHNKERKHLRQTFDSMTLICINVMFLICCLEMVMSVKLEPMTVDEIDNATRIPISMHDYVILSTLAAVIE